MVCNLLKLTALCLITLELFSCGIKRDPKPPPLPDFDLYRIGSYIYLVPRSGEITPEGFRRKDFYFVREESGRVCFTVRQRGGKEVLRCVGEAVKLKPGVEVRIEPERVLILGRQGGRFRLYPYRGELIPKPVAEFGERTELKRDFRERVYALTEVIGSVESEPLLIRVPPLEPPAPPKPEHLRITVRDGKLYLYWWVEGEVEGFLVFRNGQLLTGEPIRSNVFIDDLPEGEVVYRVISVNRFGKRSQPAVIRYRP